MLDGRRHRRSRAVLCGMHGRTRMGRGGRSWALRCEARVVAAGVWARCIMRGGAGARSRGSASRRTRHESGQPGYPALVSSRPKARSSTSRACPPSCVGEKTQNKYARDGPADRQPAETFLCSTPSAVGRRRMCGRTAASTASPCRRRRRGGGGGEPDALLHVSQISQAFVKDVAKVFEKLKPRRRFHATRRTA